MARRCAVLLALALVLAPAARAGGDFVDLAADSGHLWLVGEPGVLELDAETGRTLRHPQPASAAYPLSVAVAGGAVWVASVANGFTDGRLTRIDLRTHRARDVLHVPDGSVQYVAAGAGGVWALLGAARGSRIARLSDGGRLLRVWPILAAGRMAADASGCWVSTSGRLLHIDAAGRVRVAVHAPLGDVATGDGAAWLARSTSVLRVDERTGAVRTIVTGRLSTGGFQHDLAAADGALWVLQQSAERNAYLLRFDTRTGRRTGHVPLHGIADALVVRPGGVFVATVVAPPGRSATGYDVFRVDPRTLRRTLVARIA